MNATTVKRLAILIAVLSLVGGLGFFTQRFQVERVARSVIEEAERAEKKGNLIEAEQLYQQHCQVFPDDVKVQLKYVDVFLTVDKSPKRQAEAMQIYYGILRQTPGQEEVRRRMVQLKIDNRAFNTNSEGGVGDRVNGADLDLDILLKTSPYDGNLLFLRGRCYEEGNDAQTALAIIRRRSSTTRPSGSKRTSYYQKTIEQNAPPSGSKRTSDARSCSATSSNSPKRPIKPST